MYYGDELVLGICEDIRKHIKKVLVDHQRKKEWRHIWEKRCKVKYTKGLKNPVTSGIINPVKVSTIINMQKQMIKTRAWKRNRVLVVNTDFCRLCSEVPERVMNIISGCKMLASREYLTRHNNLLKILVVAWCKENELMERDQAWYKVM